MNQLHQITLAVEEICAGFESSPEEMYLDNLITEVTDAPVEGEKQMSLYRRRVRIGEHDDGSPIYKRIQAMNEDEANDRIVQAYIDSGRI